MPGIPEHYATLISADCRNELKNMKRRTVSAASDISQASSTSEFIDHKTVDVIAGLQYVEHLKHCLAKAFKDGHLTKSQYTEAMSDCLENNRPKEQELVVLKRQKKIVEEDLLEEAPSYTKLEDAYASLLTNKVMSASAKQKKRKFDQSKFKAVVFDYYSASKTTETNQKLVYCHLTGWHPDGVVKAAHIVPKSLKSEEVSYLFGVGQAVLSDPKNAITLESKVKLGLDSGLIVLAPMPPKEGEETKWKCVLTDKRKKNDMVYQGVKWKDIDGKELKFLGASRPARRFLYFRFVITYLHCKNSNSLD